MSIISVTSAFRLSVAWAAFPLLGFILSWSGAIKTDWTIFIVVGFSGLLAYLPHTKECDVCHSNISNSMREIKGPFFFFRKVDSCPVCQADLSKQDLI